MTQSSRSLSRRQWLSAGVRPVATSLAIGSVMLVAGSSPADAAQRRTRFDNASPLSRDPKSLFRNGDSIPLVVTLLDGNKGIPNQKIDFFVYYGKTKTFVGTAITDRKGTAKMTLLINDPRGPTEKKRTSVTWLPFNQPTATYGAAQNNILGTGFMVR